MTFITKNQLPIDFTQANAAHAEALKRHQIYITAKTEYEAFLHVYKKKYGAAAREKFIKQFGSDGFLEITSSKNNSNGIYEFGSDIGLWFHFSNYQLKYESANLDDFSSVSTYWISIKKVDVLKSGFRAAYEPFQSFGVAFLIDKAKPCHKPVFKERKAKG